MLVLILILCAVFGLVLGAGFKVSLKDAVVDPRLFSRHFNKILDDLPIMCWLERDSKILWGNKLHQQQRVQSNHPIAMHYARMQQHYDCIRIARLNLKQPKAQSYLLEEFDTKKGKLVFAHPDQLFQASTTARTNVGLTDAFINLPIGIAIFDKHNDLVSFNPVLEAQLNLPPSWLSNKPCLRSFLERLRLDGTLPEPRNFNAWRDEIVTLNQKSNRPIYSEDWHLTDGKVLRVQSKPSRNHTTTLTFEDISRYIALERIYRDEIAQLHHVLDHLDNGLILFDSEGQVNFGNREFRLLWQNDIGDGLPFHDVQTFLSFLDANCLPSADLAEIRRFILSDVERSAWQCKLTSKTTGALYVRLLPMKNGYSLLEFSDMALRDPIEGINHMQSAQSALT